MFNWAQKRGVDLKQIGIDLHSKEEDEGRIVCKCFSMTEPYLRRKIKELNLRTIPDIVNAIKAGGACMSCHHVPGGLQDLLDETWGVGSRQLKVLPQGNLPLAEPSEPAPNGETPVSPYQFSKQVEKVLDSYVRPMLQQDGGDVEILDIKDFRVYCRLSGACNGCAGAHQTLRMLVERSLKEMVDERVQVIRV